MASTSPRDTAYKRRQYLVDRTYQFQFVFRVLMVVLTVAILSGLTSSAIIWHNMYQPELSQEHLVAALLAVTMTLLVELLIAIPLVFTLGIKQSHRVVGPIARIKQTLEAIGQGDFSQRIRLRHGDMLEDLANTINQMAENLQQRHR